MPGTRHQAAPTPPRRSARERRQITYLHAMVSTDPMAQMTPTTASASPAPMPQAPAVDSGEDESEPESVNGDIGDTGDEDSLEDYLEVS